MEMKKVDPNELNLLSMNVILHAGNARDFVFQAVNKAADGEFEQADNLMQEANNEVVIAHKTQTSTLQKEAEGVEIPYSPLFGHAQDTLMTVKTEINLMKEIIKIYKKLKG
ncbi:PTS lactose/cellobiose transporter subunit IIA [Listeria immobilis]|uniref:PTS lactose/cellobiose transporter subunit IIA n=1 Tax=Listeria immobilis TaxID=2713502 RepID=A0ABR6STD4_9LIST|nr:PTS lactose/cellobiose transporter subunit IIA [Listeria immobilis]MBC1482705.1 PTS lactose/cellobiose transporter subunit IIA [Listeria immobilis]MBC1506081.1 PTS lactose/cellobiose transporter subunit IIA [Listeria immobilis]MBC1508725.1 PTS lactose/cellobiose transporter subunit IIA [Listeria immobilis]MBC1516015.1 PTS lactose/cellobiose transporter subunit IIA [Listeria immobilis]MBC6303087.1 PTS lactose/cellobiose transporter subunit IIA [Listeria immobilis]